MTLNMSAASATVRLIGPTCSIDSQLDTPGIALVATSRIKGHAAHRGLHAEEPAMSGGDADRTAAIRTDGERGDPCGNGRA